MKRDLKILLTERGAFWSAVAGGAYSKQGDPDLIACYKGRFIAIEGKTYNGTQSQWQKTRQTQIEHAGGIYILARNVDAVRDVLDSIDKPL